MIYFYAVVLSIHVLLGACLVGVVNQQRKEIAELEEELRRAKEGK